MVEEEKRGSVQDDQYDVWGNAPVVLQVGNF